MIKISPMYASISVHLSVYGTTGRTGILSGCAPFNLNCVSPMFLMVASDF